MTTTLDIVDILWARLDGSAIKAAITGKLCKHERIGNSNLEDVVINALFVDNQQLQRGIANVNVHVPDLVVTINGFQHKQPNHTRLKTLATMAVGILEDNWPDGMNYDVQQQLPIADKDAGDHYINIGIEFFIENL